MTSVLRSGTVALVGRPNAGKSTLLNRLVGEKVAITSDKPQTTRFRVRGVLTRPDAQLVFVDTPGLHKPVTALGERVNATALESTDDADVICLVVDATQHRVALGQEPLDVVIEEIAVDAQAPVLHIRGAGRVRRIAEFSASRWLAGEGPRPVTDVAAELAAACLSAARVLDERRHVLPGIIPRARHRACCGPQRRHRAVLVDWSPPTAQDCDHAGF